MATKNIVPRANNEGTLGTSEKQWNNVHTKDVALNGASLNAKLGEQDSAISGLEANKANANDVYSKANVYTKTETNNLLNAKANATNVYTKAEINAALGDKADKVQLADYLPLSGGTMSGDLRFINGDFSFKATDTNANIDIGWDYAARKGAGLGLRSVNNDRAGQFLIYARDGVNTSELLGKPDGVLTWNGKDVDVVVEKSYNYVRYSSGLQMCWEYINFDKEFNGIEYAFRDWTYPVPFKDTYYLQATANHDRFTASLSNDGFTSARVCALSVTPGSWYLGGIWVFAIGNWK